MNRPLFSLAILILTASALTAAEPALLQDDFSDPAKEGRRAMRGEWIFKDGVASCTQDDELYKKHKDHGPILFYDLKHTDAKISFQFKANGCKSVVFTGNNAAGHVFRFVANSAGTSVRAFPKDAAKKSIELAKATPLVQDVWVPVTVDLRGPVATIQLGANPPHTVQHASLASAKTNLSIGFAFGTLEVKDVLVQR
jgi:hypothetical protein